MNDSERFLLLESPEALYETDIGPADIKITSVTLERDDDAAEDRIGVEKVRVPVTEGVELQGKKKAAQKGKYDEDDIDEGYVTGFGFQVSGAYFDEKEKSFKVEYKLLPEKGAQKPLEADVSVVHEIESAPAQRNDELLQSGAAQHAAYAGSLPSVEKYTESVLGSELSATYDSGVLNIEYKNVELINGQKTYQRIVLKAENDGESVYGLTMRKFSDAGIDALAEYDGEFDSMVFKSLNGRAEGVESNFNEFYVNGEIGANAVDKATLKKGDVIEWRYAEETDGSCGGSPDFESIKSALEYSVVAKAQAQHLGLLAEKPYSAFQGFFGDFTFH
jgi:hypothetical protein